jgi:AcrR family transcriptional regulator
VTVSQKRTKQPSKTPRLSRENWIEGAIGMLAEGGVKSVEINVLAERMGVTKGSFYWHFESREDLLDAVIETWRRRTTSEIEIFIRNRVGTPLGRLKRLIRIGMSPRPDVPGGSLEMMLRDWGRRDPKVAAIMREVDVRRHSFVRELYKDVGLKDEEAESFAFLHMSYTIGGRILMADGDATTYEKGWKVGEEFLLPKI